MTVATIHVSQQAKEQLIKLKRNTGIQNWNVLCRWAFAVSLAEPSKPADMKVNAQVDLMDWKAFGGPYGDIYWTLLKQRCKQDGLGIDEETLAAQFKLHLHRGIGYLSNSKDIKSIAGLIGLTEKQPA